MSDGVSRSLKGGLTTRQLRSLGKAMQTNREEIHGHLVAAFKRGMNRGPKVQLNLSNASDGVIKEAGLMAKKFGRTP